jgi:hypothetical protein
MTLRSALAAVCLLAVGSAAHAQTPRPAPPPAQEPIEPDRPDFTNSAHMVGEGLLQIEVGGIFTRAGAGQRAFGSPFTARVGLTEWLEARVGTDGLLWQADGDARATGLGNIQLAAKLRLWADPAGIPVLSILPTVNLPAASADKGLGSGDADYTVALLTGADVGAHGHVDVNYGIGAIGAGDGRPRFAQHLVSVSASLAAGDQWNPYAEVYGFSRQDPDGGAVTSISVGAIYIVNPRLAVDGGVQFGISRAAPGFTAFGGVSVVGGDVLGSRGARAAADG